MATLEEKFIKNIQSMGTYFLKTTHILTKHEV